MKRVEPSTETSKRSRGETTTAAPASSDLPDVEEVHVDPTEAVDPSGDDDTVALQLPLLSHSVP